MPSLASQLTPSDVERAKSWIQEMYQMADSKNVGMVPKFIQEEATLNLSQTAPLKGRAALERLFTWEYGACANIIHRIHDVQISYNHIRVQVSATYWFKNGAQRSMEYLAVWHKTPQERRASRVDLDGDFMGIFQELTSFGGPPPL
ncbi:hypothetical protein CPC08DRAFT_762378 [Agrocybe pediades]|nr:hypothetical protein CPC08DRAFT_762378 [Agrocybe pediades]